MTEESRTDTDINWWQEFADDPDFLELPPDAQKKLIEFLSRSMEMKLGVVYGNEDPDQEESCIDCSTHQHLCKAKCCTFIFALTQEEAEANQVKYNKEKPFFIARDEEDGYCPHLDRESYQCEVWNNRPIRCRAYSCEGDKDIWPNGFGLTPA